MTDQPYATQREEAREVLIEIMRTVPELKPCPFCGSEATLEHLTGNYGYTYSSISVGCPKFGGKLEAWKGCPKPRVSAETEAWVRGRGTFSVEEDARKQVVTIWNARARKD